MSVPKLPLFDAKVFAKRLYDRVRRPDGSAYLAFGPDQFPRFVDGLRVQRDVVASHDVQLADHKVDLDAHTIRLNAQADRIAALEAAPRLPFPASG